MSTFIEKELQYHEDPDTEPHFVKKITCRSIFLSKLAKGLSIALIIAVVAPTLAYFFIISRNVPIDEEGEQYYCLIREEYRIPCGVVNITEAECEQVDCCFNTTTRQCHHFLPSKYYYHREEDGTYSASLKRSPVNSLSLKNIKLTIQNKTANKFSVVIHDSAIKIRPMSFDNPKYSIAQSRKKLTIEVFDEDGDSIFTTDKGALIASEKYWEWSFQLSNGTLYGLDRNLIQIKSGEKLTKVIYKNGVDHSTLPVFWANQNGKFHGAVIRHDGLLEVEVLSSNMIILRSLLGKKIEVEVTLGPTPANLYRNQIEDVTAPPFWFLGTHNCRKGNTTSNLNEILKIYEANNKSNFDTDCIHENLFMALQKSDNPVEDVSSLKTYIREATESGKRFLFSLPPHILVDEQNELYKTAKNLDILYKNQSGIVYNGTYLGQKVVYPDYSNESVSEFVKTLIAWIDKTVELKYISGFILNDNWPQDDSYGNVEKKDFPYYSEAIDTQMRYTIPWTLQGTDKVSHFEKHNSYGKFQNHLLQKYLRSFTSKELLIVSSTKRYGDTDPEISDNFQTSWENFNMYLNRILFGSISGNPMIGLPVCGDSGTYNRTLHETLCIRWYIAAATMPYFRMSSGDVFRDPKNLKSRYATRTVETAMRRRALLQDYFYTILKKSEPVVRPMYYDYYTDNNTLLMDGQYTIGKDIIVSHPLSKGKTKLQVFLPQEKGVWYEFWGGTIYEMRESSKYVDIDTFETDWTMLVAQGSVVALTNSSQIHLYIALNCSSQSTGCTANGGLFKDENLLSFNATDTFFTVRGLPSTCDYYVAYLRVYGYIARSGYIRTYSKNANLCRGGVENVTIAYTDID